jgi:hypothetical protein
MPVSDGDYKARLRDKRVKKLMSERQPLVEGLVGGAAGRVGRVVSNALGKGGFIPTFSKAVGKRAAQQGSMPRTGGKVKVGRSGKGYAYSPVGRPGRAPQQSKGVTQVRRGNATQRAVRNAKANDRLSMDRLDYLSRDPFYTFTNSRNSGIKNRFRF